MTRAHLDETKDRIKAALDAPLTRGFPEAGRRDRGDRRPVDEAPAGRPDQFEYT